MATLRFPQAVVGCLSMILLFRISAAHAEQFVSTQAKWVKHGGQWLEYGADPNKVEHRFAEVGRSADMVVLWDGSRQMLPRFPPIGGPSAWTRLDRTDWVTFSIVRHDDNPPPGPRKPRPETEL